jgi:tripartite-type tricarboxylate transporter receptor subunit TctC
MKALGVLVSAAALLPVGPFALASDYPTHAVRIVIPFAAGGQFDAIGRPIADYLTRKLGQPFLVESRSGAGGSTGATYVAQAKPDGYTLLFGSTSTFAVNPAVYKNLSYDPIKSFAPIITVTEAPLILQTNPATGFRNVADLIKAATANPSKYSFASPGPGTPPQLFGEILSRDGNIKLLHVPYSGGSTAVNDLVAGHVDIFFDSLASSVGLAEGGKVIPLMVAGPKRVAAFPDVPTAMEAGLPALDVLTWNAFAAPAGTPKEIVELLYREIAASLNAPEIRDAILRVSMTPVDGGEHEMEDRIAAAVPVWKAMATSVGVTVE